MVRSISFRLRPRREAPATPEARRIGVVDIGSNSVRLVVYESESRSPTVYFNEKTLCGLGEALEKTGRLSAEGRAKAMAALTRFASLADRMGLDTVAAVGTAALRDAEDGLEFVAEVKAKLGLDIEIASGADEARLSAQGVALGDPRADGVVADLGGASLELVRLAPGAPGKPEIGAGVTTPLGPLRIGPALAEQGRKATEALCDASLARAFAAAPPEKGQTLYVLGGSWRTLARAYMAKTDYPLHVLHGYSLDLDEARQMAAWGVALSAADLQRALGTSESRAKVTPCAALVLGRLLAALEPRRVVVSAFGLREGVLWERMPDELRLVDPLLDACRGLERAGARSPGFGAELWSFLAPAFKPEDGVDPRLGEAATLLVDAVWRTHPDYRSKASFELITRNNFGGVDHGDRLFIGAALLNRFKGSKRALRDEPAMRRLEGAPAEAAAARLGRGMRLGAELAGATVGVLPHARLERREDGLTLRLGPKIAELSGPETGKRLEALAEAFGLAPDRVSVETEAGAAALR